MTTDFTTRLTAIALTVVASATLLVGAVGPAQQAAPLSSGVPAAAVQTIA